MIPQGLGTAVDADCIYLAVEPVFGGDFLGMLRNKRRLSSASTRFYAAEASGTPPCKIHLANRPPGTAVLSDTSEF